MTCAQSPDGSDRCRMQDQTPAIAPPPPEKIVKTGVDSLKYKEHIMTVKRSSLFTDLSAQEASSINGAWSHYYSAPTFYCYPVSSWGGSSWSSGSSVNQTVNVNVKIDD
ncbi:MAG: hypothetical protein NW220_24565 [Leptolyngbyaceae cyanobacterium bins.349]|nr:hypothetical protein [Leptolyngbyaceae cyanobacterium bins.349]